MIPLVVPCTVSESVHQFDMEVASPVLHPVPYSWIGEEAKLVASFTKTTTALNDTAFRTWTPSTTAKTIVTSGNLGSVSIDTEKYEYMILWRFNIQPTYSSSATNKARLVKCSQAVMQYIIRRSSDLANVSTDTHDNNVCITMPTPAVVDYFNGVDLESLAWSASYGFYIAAVLATFSSLTDTQTMMTIKTPTVNARCSITYLSTTNCAQINKASTYDLKCDLYRFKKGSFASGIYQTVIDIHNNGI